MRFDTSLLIEEGELVSSLMVLTATLIAEIRWEQIFVGQT